MTPSGSAALQALAEEYWEAYLRENPQWATQYGVQGIPTMLFVKNGELVDRMVGAAPKPMIQQRVDNMLKN